MSDDSRESRASLLDADDDPSTEFAPTSAKNSTTTTTTSSSSSSSSSSGNPEFRQATHLPAALDFGSEDDDDEVTVFGGFNAAKDRASSDHSSRTSNNNNNNNNGNNRNTSFSIDSDSDDDSNNYVEEGFTNTSRSSVTNKKKGSSQRSSSSTSSSTSSPTNSQGRVGILPPLPAITLSLIAIGLLLFVTEISIGIWVTDTPFAGVWSSICFAPPFLWLAFLYTLSTRSMCRMEVVLAAFAIGVIMAVLPAFFIDFVLLRIVRVKILDRISDGWFAETLSALMGSGALASSSIVLLIATLLVVIRARM
jgi:hypothetical protein